MSPSCRFLRSVRGYREFFASRRDAAIRNRQCLARSRRDLADKATNQGWEGFCTQSNKAAISSELFLFVLRSYCQTPCNTAVRAYTQNPIAKHLIDSNTVRCYNINVASNTYTLEELARAVQEWCDEHGIVPANGQASEAITERTIRYYRTLSLLDAPIGNYTKSFSEKHRLQLIAIRVYQAHGLPLRKIRDELYGKSLGHLVEFEKRTHHSNKQASTVEVSFLLPVASESWSVVPLSDEFLLVSRRNQPLPRAIIEEINRLLRQAKAQKDNDTTESVRN